MCTPGLWRPPKEEKVMLKTVQRPVSQDPTVGRGWGAGGFLESQDKFVGASAELSMASLPWVTWK